MSYLTANISLASILDTLNKDKSNELNIPGKKSEILCVIREKNEKIFNNFKKKVSAKIYFAFSTAKKHVPKINIVINLDIQKTIL